MISGEVASVRRWWEVIEGDCRAVMASLEPESVDAIVCDPPYELGFMGKGWDSAGVSFEVATWRAAWRVLKPGGHLLAFGGTRTYHRIAVAIEDAGFEIRDCLSWLYGSGFPKSLDVSKAIDKRRVDDVRPVCRYLRAMIDAHPAHTVKSLAAHFGFNPRMVEHWAARDTDSQPNVPTWPQWLEIKTLLGFGDEMDAEVWGLNGRKGQPGEAWQEREIIGKAEWSNSANHFVPGEDHTDRVHLDITKAATPEAAQWAGWGTALKPAWEPVIVARKPIQGTVAANVLAHGTGALNIDGTRIGHNEPIKHMKAQDGGNKVYAQAGRYEDTTELKPEGRWPANVVLDQHAAEMLDAQSGERRSAGLYPSGAAPESIFGGARTQGPLYADKGGPSRFYYIAKASRRERNAGLAGMPERVSNKLDQRRAAYRDDRQAEPIPVANHHPTVKPIALMRWLVRLVTPPGGLVLDPFNGSGSTGIAAVLEGFRYIGIEQSAEYAEIARRRIAHWEAERIAELEAEREAPAQLALDVA